MNKNTNFWKQLSSEEIFSAQAHADRARSESWKDNYSGKYLQIILL